MKILWACTFYAAVATAVRANSTADGFGPQQCVSVSRTGDGTCAFHLQCQGLNTDGLEFAFDCGSKAGAITRHSFGRGGFDDDEVFDTGVQCERCGLPTTPTHTELAIPRTFTPIFPRKTAVVTLPQALPAAPDAFIGRARGALRTAPIRKSEEAAATQSDAAGISGRQLSSLHAVSARGAEHRGQHRPTHGSPNSHINPGYHGAGSAALHARSARNDGCVHFGPGQCVETWRSSSGHCIVQTKCGGQDISDYDFGFVCVDEEGAAERHSFGKGVFGPEQEFDTLVQCKKCMGLDSEDVHGGSAAQKLVLGMQSEVEELGKEMRSLSASVNKLEVQVKRHPHHRALSPLVASIPVRSAAMHTRKSTRRRASHSTHRDQNKMRHPAVKARVQAKQHGHRHRVNLLEKRAVTEERHAATNKNTAQTTELADADEPSFVGLQDIAKNLEAQASAVESLTASFEQDAGSDEAQGNSALGAGLS